MIQNRTKAINKKFKIAVIKSENPNTVASFTTTVSPFTVSVVAGIKTISRPVKLPSALPQIK